MKNQFNTRSTCWLIINSVEDVILIPIFDCTSEAFSQQNFYVNTK